jgi:hypothetical protein
LRKLLGFWICFAAAVGISDLSGGRLSLLTLRFLSTQDLPVLMAIFLAAVAWPFVRRPAATLARPIATALPRLPARPWAMVAAMAGLLLVVTWAGTWIVFDNYALSMDEFMANFDAVILAHGTPMARLPLEWRPFAHGLQPIFVYMTPDGTAWSSAYLPVNAAFRAIGSFAGLRSAVSPLLGAVSVVAVYAVGRRIWPARQDLALIAAILLATSSQVLVTAMTPYSMTGHLALNLIWLWLFLRGGKAGHAGAIAIGFLACGLHQFIFHPLFVAPFVLQLLGERRWRTGALYILAYAAICGFWIIYWPLAFAAMSSGPPTAHAVGAGAARMGDWAVSLVRSFDRSAPLQMFANLLRFATWQNLLTFPLAMIGGVAAFKARGTLRSLALGFVISGVVITIVMPYQGHGWGYRYWHGLLGSACLLAAFAWGRMTDDLGEARRAAAKVGFAVLTAISLLVLFPLRAWQAHRFEHPYAMAEAAIRRSPAQVVLIDDTRTAFTIDLTRNDPYLGGRRHVLALRYLSVDQVRALCSRYAVALFGPAEARRFGIGPDPFNVDDDRISIRMAQLRACGVPSVPVSEVGS